ncbi:MAG: hypothetical protein OXB84_07695 [Halobacteriovoraceae bacterium]|nr:hypothetical protein [Halobacteriovoraceae bacterium]
MSMIKYGILGFLLSFKVLGQEVVSTKIQPQYSMETGKSWMVVGKKVSKGTSYTATLSNMNGRDLDLFYFDRPITNSDIEDHHITSKDSSLNMDDEDEFIHFAAMEDGHVYFLVVDISDLEGSAGFDLKFGLKEYTYENQMTPVLIDASSIKTEGSYTFNGTVGLIGSFYQITGLAPGQSYSISITDMEADGDIYVFDKYGYLLGASFDYGDDSIFVESIDGILQVFIDASTSNRGTPFNLVIKVDYENDLVEPEVILP